MQNKCVYTTNKFVNIEYRYITNNGSSPWFRRFLKKFAKNVCIDRNNAYLCNDMKRNDINKHHHHPIS